VRISVSFTAARRRWFNVTLEISGSTVALARLRVAFFLMLELARLRVAF